MFLGIVVALAQFSGLPSSWKNWIFFICGAAIAVIAFLLRRGRSLTISSISEERRTDVYAQNSMSGTR